MQVNSNIKKGIFLALLTAGVSGISIYYNKLVIVSMEPLIFNILKNGGVAIILSMILFANSIHATTVAEGIETKQEYQTVHDMGISLGQGYYFARPARPYPEINPLF